MDYVPINDAYAVKAWSSSLNIEHTHKPPSTRRGPVPEAKEQNSQKRKTSGNTGGKGQRNKTKLLTKNRTKWEKRKEAQGRPDCNSSTSPRSISIAQLNALLRLHLRPIKLVVYERPYSFKMKGYLILRYTSRLDAFSVYYIRTRLPGYALGRTTDAPEVRPTRSSRTKVSSSQISNAHDR